MNSNIFKIFFLFLMLLFTSISNAEMKVGKVSCEVSDASNRCLVHLVGQVSPGDALYIPEIADADKTYVENIEIGSTGFFYGHRFYARFYPRVYQLDKIAGKIDPIVIVEYYSILGDAKGLNKDSQISVIQYQRSLNIILTSIAYKVLIILALSALFTIGCLNLRLRRDNTIEFYVVESIYLVSTIGITLSMSKLPRVLIPEILSPKSYYIIHILLHSLAIMSLSLISLNKLNISFKASKVITVLLFIVQVFLLTQNEKIQMKTIHASGTGLQILFYFLLMSIGVYKVLQRKNGFFKKKIYSERLLIFTFLSTSVVMFYDAFYYMFLHKVDTQYYFFYGLIAVVIADFGVCYEALRIEMEASGIALGVRKDLEALDGGKEMLKEICISIVEKFDASRVSIVSTRNRMALVLSSFGPTALPVDSTARPIGKILQKVIVSGELVFVSGGQEFEEVYKLSNYLNDSLMVPIIQNQKVIAVISMMAKKNVKISSYTSKLLEQVTALLSLEALAAINKLIADEQMEQMKMIASSTSGIVLENADSWGRIIHKVKPYRRIIVSVDGVKSTYIEQIATGSPIVWDLYRSFKQEVYAHWMSIKEVFELVSKDVRGDDFWVLSPLTFKNPYLSILGAERVALIAAVLIEEQSRAICAKPEYQILSRSGFHTSVSADDIEILPLGTESSICCDVHAKNMSKLHRIRSEAVPGAVLVDVSDPQLEKAALDDRLFETKLFLNVYSKVDSFPDLHFLPNLVNVVKVKENNEISKLKLEAIKLAAKSPYNRVA